MDYKEITEPNFEVGDRIFAKISGYRPWPAQVTEVRPDGEHCVAFYGTHEIAYVKPNVMHPYNEENIEKFVTSIKKKDPAFSAGMEEIATGVNLVPVYLDDDDEAVIENEEADQSPAEEKELEEVKPPTPETLVNGRENSDNISMNELVEEKPPTLTTSEKSHVNGKENPVGLDQNSDEKVEETKPPTTTGGKRSRVNGKRSPVEKISLESEKMEIEEVVVPTGGRKKRVNRNKNHVVVDQNPAKEKAEEKPPTPTTTATTRKSRVNGKENPVVVDQNPAKEEKPPTPSTTATTRKSRVNRKENPVVVDQNPAQEILEEKPPVITSGGRMKRVTGKENPVEPEKMEIEEEQVALSVGRKRRMNGKMQDKSPTSANQEEVNNASQEKDSPAIKKMKLSNTVNGKSGQEKGNGEVPLTNGSEEVNTNMVTNVAVRISKKTSKDDTPKENVPKSQGDVDSKPLVEEKVVKTEIEKKDSSVEKINLESEKMEIEEVVVPTVSRKKCVNGRENPAVQDVLPPGATIKMKKPNKPMNVPKPTTKSQNTTVSTKNIESTSTPKSVPVIQEDVTPGRRHLQRRAEAPSRYKEMIVYPLLKMSRKEVETPEARHSIPNGKNGKLEQALTNGKPQKEKRVTKPVVKAREIVKMQSSPPAPTVVKAKPVVKVQKQSPPASAPLPVVKAKPVVKIQQKVPTPIVKAKEDTSLKQNDASSISQEEKEEFDKLSEEELNKRLVKLSWEDERIEVLIKLMESASAKRYKCESSLDLLVKLGSEGFIDVDFLKTHPETVEIVRKMSRYVGNPGGWRMSKQLKEQLEVKTEKIRKAAETTFEHFKSLFQTNTKPLAVQLMEQMNRLNSES